ncbi:MAG: hypothetical protein KGH64_05950 [Candidatus Micrarchaeota archaeon]|nr:hypothetical protein [Candidatus Micrarchaeota archaeon]
MHKPAGPLKSMCVSGAVSQADFAVSVSQAHYTGLSPVRRQELDAAIRRTIGLPEEEPVQHNPHYQEYIATNIGTGQIIGYASIVQFGSSVRFEFAGVDSEFRRMGVYTALLRKRFEDVLTDNQIKEVVIEPTKVVAGIITGLLKELETSGSGRVRFHIDEKEGEVYIKLRR